MPQTGGRGPTQQQATRRPQNQRAFQQRQQNLARQPSQSFLQAAAKAVHGAAQAVTPPKKVVNKQPAAKQVVRPRTSPFLPTRPGAAPADVQRAQVQNLQRTLGQLNLKQPGAAYPISPGPSGIPGQGVTAGPPLPHALASGSYFQNKYGKTEAGLVAQRQGPDLLSLQKAGEIAAKIGGAATTGAIAAGRAATSQIPGIPGASVKGIGEPSSQYGPKGPAKIPVTPLDVALTGLGGGLAGKALEGALGKAGEIAADVASKGGVKAATRIAVKARVPTKAGAYARGARSLNVAAPHLATGAGAAGAGAIAAGHIAALAENPTQTLKTTARAIPGLVTAPVGIAANLGLSAARLASGQPNALEPAKATAQSVADYTKGLIQTFGSGDVNRIKKAVENQYGLTLPIMAAPGIARIGREPYLKARTGARNLVEQRRAQAGELRQPIGAEPQPITTPLANKATRGFEAKRAARTHALVRISSQRALKPLVSSLRKAPRGSEHAVALVAQEGINLTDPGLARQQLDAVRAKIGDTRNPEAPATAQTAHDALAYIDQNPKVLSDKHFAAAVDAFKSRVQPFETSPVKKYQSVALTHGIQAPYERVPQAVRGITNATTRDELAAEVNTTGGRLGSQVKELKALARRRDQVKKQAQLLQAEYSVRSRVEPDKAVTARRAQAIHGARTQLDQLTQQIKGHAADIAAKRKALKNPDEAGLTQEFLQEAKAVQQQHGLTEPAYVHHADVRKAPGLSSTLGRFNRPSAKQHMSEAQLEKQGLADMSWQGLVRGSVVGPRTRKAMQQHTAQFVKERTIPIETPAGTRRVVTREEAARATQAGQFSSKHVTFWPLQQFKQAVLGDANAADEALAGAVPSIAREIRQRATETGEKGILVNRVAKGEFTAQMEPATRDNILMNIATGTGRGFSRVILGTSPAWAIAQVVAEGAQAVAAAPRPIMLARALKDAQALAKRDPEGAAAVSAMASETPGVAIHPKDMQLTPNPDVSPLVSKSFGIMDRTAPGRIIKSIAKIEPLSAFDRWKGGKIRVALAGAQVERQFNNTVFGIRKFWLAEKDMAGKLSAMPRADRLAYVAKHPELSRKIENYVDDVMGNWSAFTHNERAAAALSIFYPFLRMSLRWVFWSFPKQHPIKAAILWHLGQWNANELSKMLGGDPSFYPQYSDAVIRGGPQGQATAELPLSRIAPGGNAVIQAVGQGTGAQSLQALNPAVAAAVSLVTGVDPLSGRRLPEEPGQTQPGFLGRASLALSQLLATPTPFRLADVLKGPKAQGALPVVGPRKPNNALGQLVQKLQGSPQSRVIRSGLEPFQTYPADKQRDLQMLGNALSGMSKNKVTPADQAAASTQAQRDAIVKKRAASKQAQAQLEGLYAKYGLTALAAKEKAQVKQNFKATSPLGGRSSGGGSIFYGGGSSGGGTAAPTKPKSIFYP